jgi:hypothetical protein
LAVGSGGTGAITLTGLLQGNGTSPITAVTGTAGQFPYFNGTNTLLATSSLFLASSGDVGIGTASPTRTLEVAGTSRVSVPSGTNGLEINNTSVGHYWTLYPVTNGSNTDLGFFNQVDNKQDVTFQAGGNVGIGITSPQSRLSVVGPDTSGSTAALTITNSTPTTEFQVFDNGNATLAGNLALSGTTGTSTIASGQGFTIGGSQFVVQQSSGNVGIGTTSPIDNLTVAGVGDYNGGLLLYGSTNNGVGLSLQNAVSGGQKYDLFSGGSGLGDAGDFVILDETSAQAPFEINTSDEVGVEALAAGTSNSLCYNTSAISGENTLSTCSSDQRLKQNITSLNGSTTLAQLMQLNPVSFNWNPQFASSTPLQFGLIAQQVEQVWPNLISTTSPTALTPDGTLSLNFNGLFGPIIAAIQQLDQQLSALSNTVAGFAESFTTNQLTFTRATGGDLSVNTLEATTTTTQQLCVSDGPTDQSPVCVTKAELAALLSAAGAFQSTESVTSSAAPGLTNSGNSDNANPTPAGDATDTPPVIQINGDNPATIQVGATYTDLGATITGPQADLNLGIQTFVNGAPMNPIVIDTSEAATDTIAYVVADQSGLTATSTRTVIIQAVSQTAPPAANDNQASSTPPAANDNTPPSDSTSTATTAAQ